MGNPLKWPGREAAWWTLTATVASAAWCYAARTWDMPLLYGMGALFALAALGLWARQGWARRLCAVGYLIPAGVATYRLAQDGYDLPRLAMAVIFIVSAWILWTADLGSAPAEPPPRDQPPPPTPLPDERPLSLVALLAEPQYLDATILARLAGKAWKTWISTTEDDDDGSYVVGDAPQFLLMHQRQLFAIHSFDRSYFDQPEAAAAEIPEQRAREAVLRHRAWISVDRIGAEGSAEARRAAYRLVGRLLAELIDDDCLAIICPDGGTLQPYSAETPALLRGSHPYEDLTKPQPPPVVPVPEDDPRMQAATAEARRRWPEFVAAFENRAADQKFSVKAPLRSQDVTEYVWINVTAIEENIIFGRLGNEPVQLPHQLGDRVRASVNEVNDWIYLDGQQMHGGLTIAVLNDLMSRQQHRDPGG